MQRGMSSRVGRRQGATERIYRFPRAVPGAAPGTSLGGSSYLSLVTNKDSLRGVFLDEEGLGMMQKRPVVAARLGERRKTELENENGNSNEGGTKAVRGS